MKLGIIAPMLLGVVTLGAGVPALADIPAGTAIDNGIAVHMPQAGITFMEQQVPALVPSSINVPDQSGSISCLVSNVNWQLVNGVAKISVQNVTITPQEGKLAVHIAATASATARVNASGCLLSGGCNVTLGDSPVTADTTIALAMGTDSTTGRPKVIATTEAFNISVNMANPSLSSCSGLDSVLGALGNLILPLFHDLIQGQVDNALNSNLKPALGPAIEGAFNALNLQGSMTVAGAQLDYDFYPTSVAVHPGSIGIIMGGDFNAHNAAACVDPNRGSAYTGDPLPVYSATAPNGQAYDVAASLSDDTLNQLLFAVWRGGLLCQNISQLGGNPLTGSMLDLVGGSVTQIVSPDGPLILALKADDPPLAILGQGGSTVALSVSNLHIDMMATVEDRLARIMRITLGANATIDLTMNSQDQVVTSINIDPSAIQAVVDYNELAPDENSVMLNVLPVLVAQLLPSLSIPPISLPSLGGVSISSADITPDGPGNGYLSVYGGLSGQVNPGGCSGGVGGTGGCGAIGGTGCSVEGGPGGRGVSAGPGLLFLGLAAVAARRRRG